MGNYQSRIKKQKTVVKNNAASLYGDAAIKLKTATNAVAEQKKEKN